MMGSDVFERFESPQVKTGWEIPPILAENRF
jgi:hypothetical protein